MYTVIAIIISGIFGYVLACLMAANRTGEPDVRKATAPASTDCNWCSCCGGGPCPHTKRYHINSADFR